VARSRLGLVLAQVAAGVAMMLPPCPFVIMAMVVSFMIGWQIEDCRYLRDPQPAIVPGALS
jgi:hypothetical protein